MTLGERYQDRGRLLISSPQGHSGKTIVTLGLCHALRKKGYSVQPFKKGPDFIDPSWLSVAAGRSCRNLDLFLIPEDRLRLSFNQACRDTDLALIEGAMGLYDGLDSVEHGTSAGLARLLRCPILLIVNAARMTTSVAAMVTGYQRFEQDVLIGGVILNHVAGPRHEQKLRAAVEKHCKIPVVGSIPRDVDLHIDERHLGLIPSAESRESRGIVERIGERLAGLFDLDEIVRIAGVRKGAENIAENIGKGVEEEPPGRQARVGVILDRVFNFYYPENLEALARAGAELVFVDSASDRLPEVDGLYVGGGFPEFFVKELQRNESLRGDIACGIEKGLPVYAECAGLMYLCRRIFWQNQPYDMVGVIPADVYLSRKPRGHGYVQAEVTAENPLFPRGLTIRGHEFHHSSLSLRGNVDCAYEIRRGQGIDGRRDGIVYNNVVASYTHLHALGTPEWSEGFMALVSQRKRIQSECTEGGDTLATVP